MLKPAIVAAVLALAGGPLAAQTMYRCGNSYGHEPCPGATLVQAAQRPSDAAARQAESAAQKDQRRADAMEKARLAQEARASKALIIGGEAPAESKAAQSKRTEKKQEHFTATTPKPAGENSGKKKKKS